MGRDAVAAWFGAASPRDRPHAEMPQVVGPRAFAGIAVLGLAAPFGRLDAAMLRATADVSAGELRLTPWRTILLPGVVEATVLGFIVDPADPRLRVAACTGAAGCEHGATDTHADATRFAPLAAAMSGTGIALHVSGCAKGCAHPRPATVTLVGREGRYEMVRDGRPGDAADGLGLLPQEIEGLLHRESITVTGEPMPHLPSPQGAGEFARGTGI